MTLGTMDLRVGDVMLKLYHGGLVHWLIRTFTANEGPASNFVHAALYLGNGEIGESIGKGYSFTELMNQGQNYRYFVFRYADEDLASIAAHILSTWIIMGHGGVEGYRAPGPIANRHLRPFGGYGLGQAVGGAMSNRLGHPGGASPGEGESFWGSEGRTGVNSSYCSQFVVQAYNAAGATALPPVVAINVPANRATPALLHNALLGDGRWRFMGSLVAR